MLITADSTMYALMYLIGFTLLTIIFLASVAGLFSFSRWLYRCTKNEICARDIDSGDDPW